MVAISGKSASLTMVSRREGCKNEEEEWSDTKLRILHYQCSGKAVTRFKSERCRLHRVLGSKVDKDKQRQQR